MAAALDAVSKSWSANRAQLYDHVLTPEFSRIVAESIKDADVTPVQRAALAAAWRGLSRGLGREAVNSALNDQADRPSVQLAAADCGPLGAATATGATRVDSASRQTVLQTG